MNKAEYKNLIKAVTKMGEYDCTGVKCKNCPLSHDGACMVVTMIRQLSAYKEAGNVKE